MNKKEFIVDIVGAVLNAFAAGLGVANALINDASYWILFGFNIAFAIICALCAYALYVSDN